ncbi:hypothetical protein WA171_005910 [Blastocystis sp. BT1]
MSSVYDAMKQHGNYKTIHNQISERLTDLEKKILHCESVSALVENDEFFNQILLDIKESIESLQSALNESSIVIKQTVNKKNDEIMDIISTYNRLIAKLDLAKGTVRFAGSHAIPYEHYFPHFDNPGKEPFEMFSEKNLDVSPAGSVFCD